MPEQQQFPASTWLNMRRGLDSMWTRLPPQLADRVLQSAEVRDTEVSALSVASATFRTAPPVAKAESEGVPGFC
eukprot:8769916-Alexandrium_andersonii.AAC.1